MGESYQIKDQEALYFLTFHVVGWADVFTRKLYRDIIIESFRYRQQTDGLVIYAYVIMSNHVHCILRSSNGALSETIRDFKKFTSKRIMKEIEQNPVESRGDWLPIIFRYHARFNRRVENRQFWTHYNHAVELSSNHMINTRLNYIHMNPVKAGIVRNPEEYIYSSASNYCGLDSLLDVELIELS